MGHDWIFDVLKDLTSYARANGLPALASKAEEALRVAEAEVADAGRQLLHKSSGCNSPNGKPH
jgi:hypothetical protein